MSANHFDTARIVGGLPTARPAFSAEMAALRKAAESGHVEAQSLLGQALLNGVLLPRGPSEAARWFSVAARAGYLPALNMQGQCLEKGWGVPPDAVAAAACYRRAAKGGHDWAQYNLANMMLRGRGVARDRAGAWTLFLTAAKAGHAKSMNLVARFLEEGWDRPRDPAAAEAWYRCSAEAGDYRGRHNLATLLAEAGALDEAMFWWCLAVHDATADILCAMAQALRIISHPAAPALLRVVEARQAPHREDPPTGRWRRRFNSWLGR